MLNIDEIENKLSLQYSERHNTDIKMKFIEHIDGEYMFQSNVINGKVLRVALCDKIINSML